MVLLNRKRLISLVITLLVVIAGVIGGYILYQNRVGAPVQFTGRVTAYNTLPNAYDGPTVFTVDGTRISVGGGLTDTHFGEIESGVKVGDRVEVRGIRTEYGVSLACYDCWIHKAD